MTDHQDRAGETAPLKALSERWRSKAALTHPDVQYYYGGQRDALDACADELDAALSRLSAPQGETAHEKQEADLPELPQADRRDVPDELPLREAAMKSGETARIAEIERLAAKWSDFEFWKAEGGRMDSQDCAQELQRLLSRLSASPVDVGPTRCTCWLSTSSTFGLSEDRERCAVHGDHVQQAADVGPQAQGITAPASDDWMRGYETRIFEEPSTVVLQAVLEAISGTLDPHSQIADHPNVKFAQMERLKLLAGTVSQAQEKA